MTKHNSSKYAFSQKRGWICIISNALFGLVAAGILTCGLPLVAEGQEKVSGEVLVILGKETGSDSSAELAEIDELTQPPFSAYKSKTVLSKSALQVAVGSEGAVTLPNGRKLQVRLERIMPDKRYLVRVSITKSGEKDYLPLLQVAAEPGKRFFVAGQQHNDGTLFVGIKLGK